MAIVVPTNKKVLIALSGGADSATLLAKALSEGKECSAVAFTYGSKHGRWEVDAAEKLATHYKIPFGVLSLASITQSFHGCALLKGGGAVPEGHYQEETMHQTVVPGRNIIFASILAGVAWNKGLAEVWMGVHAGDHFIYPDCRPAFIDAMGDAVFHGTDFNVKLRTPFLMRKKVDIIKEGFELHVPYALTRTCYKDQMVACGKCGSCQERLEAFVTLGATDPLAYDFRELLPKTTTAADTLDSD